MLCVRSKPLGRMPMLREPCAPFEHRRQIEEPYWCMNLMSMWKHFAMETKNQKANEDVLRA